METFLRPERVHVKSKYGGFAEVRLRVVGCGVAVHGVVTPGDPW